MGGLQDRYLRYEAAGDQYCGRIVSGLQVDSSKFAVLPPHFLDPIDCQVLLAVLPQLSLHEKLKALLEHSIASFLYHLEWLRSNLTENHSLFNSRLFESSIWNQVRTYSPVLCSSRMYSMGIPPHIAMLSEMSSLQSAMNSHLKLHWTMFLKF